MNDNNRMMSSGDDELIRSIRYTTHGNGNFVSWRQNRSSNAES